ncbi:hypothetical protein SO802_015174 [Lithocarpus litseifolius]|uniref:Uncharacterized protein n=1 Tax=Lithocarpus litseifolius TaxID=425828 RepID=A0AAW2CV30_9ROSI
MSETIISSSSNSIEKAIDEYHDNTSYSSSSNSTSHSGSKGSTTDEGYTSGVPGVPLEVLQKQLRKPSGSQTGTSSNAPPSSPLDEVETVYSCAVGISSKTNEQRLSQLKLWDTFAPYTGELGNLRPEGITTMKENRGKEPMDKGSRPKIQSQVHPSTGEKRKSVSKNLDLGNLPSRRGKKPKHGSS